MHDQANRLVNRLNPLSATAVQKRANCFNGVMLYWGDTESEEFVGPEQFVKYIQTNFEQIDPDEKLEVGDVTIVWSRSDSSLEVGQLQLAQLTKDEPGYPFGLVIEHSFVALDSDLIFQKRDPSASGPYERVTRAEALAPYTSCFGYELTSHRRRV